MQFERTDRAGGHVMEDHVSATCLEADPNETRAAENPRELKRVLAEHRGSSISSAVWQLATTLVLFVIGWACMWACLPYGYWISLLIAVPTSGMLMRLFVLQHDCGHGAMFASTKVNRLVGVALSALTLTPYQCWRRQHAQHHATNGQLDHRGVGDVTMHTLEEYRALSTRDRWIYRIYRHPLILFGIGPLLYFGIYQRLPGRVPKDWPRERMSIHGTNLLLAVVFAAMAWLVGPLVFVKLHLPVLAMAASAGSWLFFVQHQFNPSYWEHDDDWDYHRAAIDGSSFLDLPRPLRWLTANIGYHHIHHLDSRIPNYALPACHAAHPDLRLVERLTLVGALRCSRLKIWDEEARELITFRQAKRRLQQPVHRRVDLATK
jgi:acyl-lipid omega-6 desaturase (Delta-12 desaturase)